MRIEGSIYGNSGGALVPIKSVVMIMNPATGQTQALQYEPGDKYWIDGDETFIRTLIVIFASSGFKSIQTTGAELIDHGSSITLEKSNAFLLMGAAIVLGWYLIKRKRKVGAVKTEEIMPFLMIAGALFAANIIQKILDKLGLGGNPTLPEQQDPNSPWKPTYWQKFSTYTYAITTSQAKEYAKTIHNAFTLFQDDYNAVFSVFSAMKTKANVSYVSYWFNQDYNEDLLSFLTDGGGILPWDGLSKEHLNTLLSLVRNLPTN